MQSSETNFAPPVRRRYRRWIVLAGLIAGLVWLNGPGLRWLAPKLAGHFLTKAGFRGDFELEGSLTGGLRVKNLRLESDETLALITIGRVDPDYRLSDLMKGKLDGIKIDGLHVDLRIGLNDDKPDEAKNSLDLETLMKTLRTVRSHVIPLEADLDDISLSATKDGKPVFSLASSRIRHKAGQPEIDIQIGTITDATGREWPARESLISWKDGELKIDQLDPLPGLSVRGLTVQLPESGGPAAEAEIRVNDAVFLVNASPGFSSIQVNLREGRLTGETLAASFGIKLPVGGDLSSFSANVDNLLPEPMAATGSAQLLLEKVTYMDWTVPELSLDAALESASATVAARAVALDTEISLDAAAEVVRADGNFLLGETRGRFNVTEVAKLVAALAGRVEVINPNAPVPVSGLDGGFRMEFAGNKARSADVDLVLKPVDPEVASSLSVRARWQPEQPVAVKMDLDGVAASAEYDFEKTAYEGNVEFKDFKSARIDRWLAAVKAGTGGMISLTGNWSGGGAVKAGSHHGAIELAAADFTREGAPPIHAKGEIDYDWPSGFTTRGIQVNAADQTVAVDLNLADGFLQMSNLLWRDGDRDMASGSAKLPVPEDFSKWRDMLAHDDRPVAVSIDSKVLSLVSLKDWVPAAESLDPRSTGLVSVKVSGSYAKPVIDALLEARDLRSPQQPRLPPADLKFTVNAREGRVSVEGNVTTADYAPAVVTAAMPFRPAEWAENPGLVMAEPITARADLPRIDLSRFTTLVPGARRLSGSLAGNVEVAGEFGKPEMKGWIGLTNGGFEMTRSDIPAFTGLSASVDLSLAKIALRELQATVAGGSLAAAGSLALENGKPGNIDFRVKGDHLPIKRDDSLIVRANADLRLSGPWQQAALTGTIGVVDSIFFRDIELLPIGKPFTGPAAAKLPNFHTPSKPEDSMPEPFRNWTLDVLAKTENPFLIRGNLATGQAVGSVRIRGSLGSPAPDGEVRISDVRASLPFSTLTVHSGTLRFTPESGFDPILEIRGRAEPRPYQVYVYVYGRASDPQLILTSSPPLPENEIMTLLATGTTTSGLEDPQAASSRALQLFAEELRRGRFGVGKRLRPMLKLLDRVDFTLAEKDPYSSESYSTATLQITDRWYLSAGMGAEGDSRVLAIWRLRFY